MNPIKELVQKILKEESFNVGDEVKLLRYPGPFFTGAVGRVGTIGNVTKDGKYVVDFGDEDDQFLVVPGSDLEKV